MGIKVQKGVFIFDEMAYFTGEEYNLFKQVSDWLAILDRFAFTLPDHSEHPSRPYIDAAYMAYLAITEQDYLIQIRFDGLVAGDYTREELFTRVKRDRIVQLKAKGREYRWADDRIQELISAIILNNISYEYKEGFLDDQLTVGRNFWDEFQLEYLAGWAAERIVADAFFRYWSVKPFQDSV